MNMGDFYQRIKSIQQFLSPENQAHRCQLCPKVCPAPAPKQAPWPLARRDREHVPRAASRLSGSRDTSNMGKPNSWRGWAAPGLVVPGVTDTLLSTSKVYLQLALRSRRQSRRHQSAACSTAGSLCQTAELGHRLFLQTRTSEQHRIVLWCYAELMVLYKKVL